jgi:hypothetical protein
MLKHRQWFHALALNAHRLRVMVCDAAVRQRRSVVHCE